MYYKIAICDDSKADLNYISSLVTDWAKLSGNTVNIKTFPSAEALLFHYSDDKSYDILMLDIEMGNMNGVQLAKEIRKENDAIQIIFITGYSDYIAEGYEVSALHYLMKPIDQAKLFSTLPLQRIFASLGCVLGWMKYITKAFDCIRHLFSSVKKYTFGPMWWILHYHFCETELLMHI
jgi:DNA-binding LytR/AlgR family response regulator